MRLSGGLRLGVLLDGQEPDRPGRRGNDRRVELGSAAGSRLVLGDRDAPSIACPVLAEDLEGMTTVP
jgi:hypothetical protein